MALQGKNDQSINVYAIEQQIKELNQCRMDMIELSVKSGIEEEKFDEDFKKISDEISSLKEIIKTNNCSQNKADCQCSKLNEIFEIIEKEDFSIKQYDDILTRQFIECIKVISKEKLQIIFKGCIEIEQDISKCKTGH